MRSITALIGWLLCSAIASAQQIEIPETSQVFRPLVAKLPASAIPEGAEIRASWTWSAGVSSVEVSPNVHHVWAPPGSHTVSVDVTWLTFDSIEIAQADGSTRIVKVLKDWDVTRLSKTFKVEGASPNPNPQPNPQPRPNPTPNPQPNPSPQPDSPEARFAVIVEQGWQAAGKPAGQATVASVYRNIADVANGKRDVWRPADMLGAVRVEAATKLSATQIQAWQSFWPSLSKAMNELQIEEADTAAMIDAFRLFADTIEAVR